MLAAAYKQTPSAAKNFGAHDSPLMDALILLLPTPRSAVLTERTALLDYEAPTIRELVDDRGWRSLSRSEQIGAVYSFVRDEIKFGYNHSDDLPASLVLSDGYGQCNTKATLLMALLRSLGIPCRLHGFTVDKQLQRGIVPEIAYAIAPREILHSWVEVAHEGAWINLEGFILDVPYLKVLDRAVGRGRGICGFGAGTDDLDPEEVEWQGRDTYIQHKAIVNDLGRFDTPDAFYGQHGQRFSAIQSLLYRYVVRRWMNWRVERVRAGRPWSCPGVEFAALPARGNG